MAHENEALLEERTISESNITVQKLNTGSISPPVKLPGHSNDGSPPPQASPTLQSGQQTKKLSFETEVKPEQPNDGSKADGELRRGKSRDGKSSRTVATTTTTDASAMFTFHPVVSDNSSKIAARLKTDFWQRQQQHVDKQLDKQKRRESEIAGQSGVRLSPVQNKEKRAASRKSKSDKNKSTHMPPIGSPLDELLSNKQPGHVGSEANARSKEAAASMSEGTVERKGNMPQIGDCRGSPTHHREGKNKSNLNTTSSSVASKNSFEKSRKSTKTPRGEDGKPDWDSTTADEQKKQKKLHYRRLTNEQLDAGHTRMMKAKEIAGKAVQNKKVFLCCGPYRTIRGTLRHRGWVEKYFKPRARATSGGSDDSGDDSGDDHDVPPMEKEDCPDEEVHDTDSQYGIMSRVVRNVTPMMIWTLRRDDIDYKSLRKDQIINHFGAAGTFTTKVGLSRNLRNAFIYGEIDCLQFYPRCYILSSDEGKEEFLDDFRLSTARNVLKLTMKLHQEWNEECKRAPASENGVSLRSSASDVPASHSSGGATSSSTAQPIVLSSKVITQALRACYQYLDFVENLDIEEDYKDRFNMTDSMWDALINSYNQIVHEGAVVMDASKMAGECKNVIERIKPHFPQHDIDGTHNLWIIKPGAKSRGRGIVVMNRLQDILALTNDSPHKEKSKWVVQKYIERPLLVYNTKFDIRQWFLVTKTNPLVFWFYKDCYIRFCGQEFSLTDLNAQIHLSNNSVQKHYEPGERTGDLPDSNMWHSDTFKSWLARRGNGDAWDKLIYPGMKSAIKLSLLCCQDALETRKNSFELYGADFMLSDDLKPWLIEINSSPALGASTDVTEVLCQAVIEDTFKVVIDRRTSKNCDIGKFDLAFKQPSVTCAAYMGTNLAIAGEGIISPRQTNPKPAPKPTTTSTAPPPPPPPQRATTQVTTGGADNATGSNDALAELRRAKRRSKSQSRIELRRKPKPKERHAAAATSATDEEDAPITSRKPTLASESKVRSPIMRMTVRHGHGRGSDANIYRMDNSHSDGCDQGKVSFLARNSKYLLETRLSPPKQPQATTPRSARLREATLEEDESPDNDDDGGDNADETGDGSTKAVDASKLPPARASSALGAPCRLTNFSMGTAAGPPTTSTTRPNGIVPFVVTDGRAAAHRYHQRYSHAPPPPAAKRPSPLKHELFGAYHKLYANTIDLKPGHGVRQIQKIFL